MSDVECGDAASYRIVVKGWLSESSIERLGDMKIASVEGKGRETVTVLVGPVRDPGELSGILNTIYGMHVSLLTVERRNEKENKE